VLCHGIIELRPGHGCEFRKFFDGPGMLGRVKIPVPLSIQITDSISTQ
jgi:hypothetical protein